MGLKVSYYGKQIHNFQVQFPKSIIYNKKLNNLSENECFGNLIFKCFDMIVFFVQSINIL